jgi:hypothetical protein
MQPMIYETAVPMSHARHGNWSLEAGTNYTFCRNVNSVPVMAAEFASAALEYASQSLLNEGWNNCGLEASRIGRSGMGKVMVKHKPH